MDKSRMTFTFRESRDETAASSNVRDYRERRPFEYRPGGAAHEKRTTIKGEGPVSLRFTWIVPALLAAVTGIVLGLGLLFLFKNVEPDPKPTVTSNSGAAQPAGAPAADSSSITLQGMSLVAYQVGVFGDQERAKNGAAELEKIGLYPVQRMSEQVQLFAGVAADKTQGQALAEALTKQQAHFYQKEYVIKEKKGVIQGVAAKDATTLASVLTQTVQVIKEGVGLGGTPSPDKAALAAWGKRVQDLNTQAALARKVLDKSGRKGELVRFDDIQQQLKEAAAAWAAGKSLLEVQRNLVQSIVDYEELGSKLIQ